MKNRLKQWFLVFVLAVLPCLAAAAQGHGGGDAGHGEHEGEGALRLDAAAREAGVGTAPVARRVLAEEITAPGEVRADLYRTARVTPRIQAQVVARHARLGDRVKRGRPLVTLSSIRMAEAQGALVEAEREWRRVRRLGRKVVSEKRYVAAQVARQLAYARVLAYGMTKAQVDALLEAGDALRATGEFDLLAPRDGTVVRDGFVLGEVVEPGRVLFELTDESVLWVEARLAPEDAARVRVGHAARIRRTGGAWVEGRVIQVHHRLDEATRTRSVRIQVDNRDERLHPGEFVDVVLEVGGGEAVLAVPAEAVVLMEGSPAVFKVEGGALHPQPVETGLTRGGWTEIRAGLAEGDEVVVRGVFLLKALLLRSRLGEGHAH